MGKTYRSFDKNESFDYHSGEEALIHRKNKSRQIKHFNEVHINKKSELLNKLTETDREDN